MVKTPNAFIALDLEMNQPSGRIIQVGIAIGSQMSSDEEYLVKKWYIDPEEPLNPDIEALTGITQVDLTENSVSVAVLCQELSAILDEWGTDLFVNPVTWGGGDMEKLKQLFAQHGLEFHYFGRRWLDVKTLHVFQCFTRKLNANGGLRSAMPQYGLRFVGTPHRADVDALNTLRLLFAIWDRQQSLEGMVQLAKSVHPR